MIEYVLAFLGLYAAVFYLLIYISEEENVRKDPAPKKFPAVSVVIPAYNEEKTIGKTIESVLALDYPKNKLEVIVVDDGSKDRTAEIVKLYKIKLISKKNTGKANSLNVAIRQAKGELVATMDADSHVGPNALKCMVGYFEDPDVAAVTSAIKVWEPKTMVQKLQKGDYLVNAFFKKLQSFVDGISVTAGPFSVYRKPILEKLGGFAEDTLTEDLEIALRIQSANLRIENSLNAEVFTEVPRRLRDLLKQRRRWYLGYIENIWKYRLLFSPKYGDFGLFVLPAAVAILAVSLALFLWANLPRSLDTFLRFEPMPASLLYLEFTPVRVVFLSIFLLNALAFYYTLRNTRESGFLGNFLSLFAISTMMLLLWFAVLGEQIANSLRGVKPAWRGD
jgi:cellulose synthase/poly-beta-1,6-N-acetylglucosamine synthase-like glycosyltransferase